MSDRTGITIESPGVNVAIVREDRDGWKFLLLKRGPGESYAGIWGYLTGTKQHSETVAQVAVRELSEETDLVALSLWATEYVIQFYEPEYEAIWILPLVVAVVSDEAEVKLSPENSEYRWLSAEQAKRLAGWKNVAQTIDALADELAAFPARNWVEITA